MKIIQESSVRRICQNRGLSSSELLDEATNVEAESSKASDPALAPPDDLKKATVEKAYRDMIRVLPPQMLINLGRRMRILFTHQPTIAVATACSGTDIVLKMLDMIFGTFNSYWGYKFEQLCTEPPATHGAETDFPNSPTTAARRSDPATPDSDAYGNPVGRACVRRNIGMLYFFHMRKAGGTPQGSRGGQGGC